MNDGYFLWSECSSQLLRNGAWLKDWGSLGGLGGQGPFGMLGSRAVVEVTAVSVKVKKKRSHFSLFSTFQYGGAWPGLGGWGAGVRERSSSCAVLKNRAGWERGRQMLTAQPSPPHSHAPRSGFLMAFPLYSWWNRGSNRENHSPAPCRQMVEVSSNSVCQAPWHFPAPSLISCGFQENW